MANILESELKVKMETDLNEDIEIKQEKEYEEMETEENHETFVPALLGLQRVGEKSISKQPSVVPPPVTLNRRGMPARIRKKNKLFFDDDIINSPPPRASPKRGPKPSPMKQQKTPTSKLALTPKQKTTPPIKVEPINSMTYRMQSNDNYERDRKEMKAVQNSKLLEYEKKLHERKIGQRIGLRLRNLLKLPKAHKWVCYEWFYSDLDKALLGGENDFMICLRESFPELKTRELTRVVWTRIRRMMGKPRRCSALFLEEERRELERKRNKIRVLQQRKVCDVVGFSKDLPSEIPLPLVIGTKVTARLRKPQDGLFTGQVDAVDTSNNTYRITFDRPGLGTHSIPDFEVQANEPPDTMDLTTFSHKFRMRQNYGTKFETPKAQGASCSKALRSRGNDPLMSAMSPFTGVVPLSDSKLILMPSDGYLGGYPIKLLELIVRVTKILNSKRRKINKLKDMNSEAEKLRSYDEQFPEDFERRYASVLIDLERMNRDLKEYLSNVQSFCLDLTALAESPPPVLHPSQMLEKCKDDALKIVKRNNTTNLFGHTVSNTKSLNLIADLTSLMLQVKCIGNSSANAYDLSMLSDSMALIKKDIFTDNQQAFQDSVEVHMQQIHLGLSKAILNNCVSH